MDPFLNTSKLTDEEILERLGRAYTYMHMQKTLGHTPTVQSIKEVIQSLEDEKTKRTQRLISDELLKRSPQGNKSIDFGKLEE